MTTAKAELPPPGSPDVLYLIDLSSYVFRAYHAITPLSSPSGEPTHATYGTAAMLHKLIGERKPELLAVAMDSKSPTFRKEIDPEYKANRAAPPPDLSVQMERAREIIDAWAIPVFQCEGIEADDLIASIIPLARARGLRVVVAGADKDLMQLVEPDGGVVLWDTMRDKVYGPAEVEEKFGVPPAQMRDLLALMGDTSDNVPGVPSVGPKTAADLLKQFGTIDGIYARLDEVKKPKLREALATHEADARMSQRLVTLRHDQPCGFDPEKLHFRGWDGDRLRRLYGELGFTRLVSQVPEERRAAPGSQPATRSELATILDADALAALCARAREKKWLALAVHGSSAEPMRADLVGLALSAGPGEGAYVPIAHRYIGVPQQLSLARVRELVGPVLADASVRKIGHDLKYADVALSRHGMRLEGHELDTMLASWLDDPEAPTMLPIVVKRELDVDLPTYDQVTAKARGSQLGFDEVDLERAGDFAARSIEAVARLAGHLAGELEKNHLTKLARELEMPLSIVLADMERAGVLVDFRELGRLAHRVDAEIVALEKRCKEAAGRDFNPGSPRQLEAVLFDELGLKVVKRTKTGRSTDADVLEQLAADHPLPGLVLEHRQLCKLKGTYIDTLPQLVHKQTGRIHTRWMQAVAATGRISSADPNLQNIPVRTDLGKAIRRAFVAPDGMSLVSADYSQIELRVLAHLSQDPVLIDGFRRGEDVHTRTASEIFGVAPADVTSDMRRKAKAINFGIVYGMGEVTLAKRIDSTRAEAAAWIDAYFRKYERVRAYLDRTLDGARKTEQVRTLYDRRRLLPNLRSSNSMLRAAAERVATNTPIQGTAADLLKLAMLALAEPVVPGARMVLTVHDELVFEVPDDRVAEASAKIRDAMMRVADLAVPLEVDVASGKSWGDVA